jgi:iodotyrosine deiodinase
MSEKHKSAPAPILPTYTEAEQLRIATKNREALELRRSLRDFSDRPVSIEAIHECLRAAGLAPSGANLQPWHFVVVTKPDVKHQIRVAAEAEETAFYNHLAPDEWLDVLTPLGTDAQKPFLETAPCLIAIFRKPYDVIGETAEPSKRKNYYSMESVGIATGFLIRALHEIGLSTLTHTPSPMQFLNQILERPSHERPFLLLVVGYPSDSAQVPVIEKKAKDEFVTVF